MTERYKSPMRSRAIQLGGALALGAVLLAGAPLAAFAQDATAAAGAAAAPAAPKPTDVLAKVGNETITGADLNYAAEDLGQQLQSVPPQDREAFLVSVLIDMKIMGQAARTAKLDQTDDYKARLAYLEDRALRRAYFEQNIVPAVTPDAVKAAYDAYVKAFKPQDEVHARHILVATQAEAQDIEKQLAGGAKFEDLAKAKSTDTGSAANGGDLGFFQKGQMVKPFEDAAFSLNVGQVSQPIQTQYGWHIIRVDEKRKTQPIPMAQLAQQLQQQVLFKKFDDAVANLKKTTPVSVPDPTLAAAVKAQSEANAQAAAQGQGQPGQ
ncbi:MAG TPA: peptidylprolyl isomerase [Devosiaceae bacterium]|nr:peptidylprolyl isomerase [Devosiaceae bacterium]